ncbi:MAG: hypothetical protein JKY66_02040, partial [Spongiibacteraceae bacterium]|nr:hypothetical protein [Spongiibacteraceae bacterium]
MMSLLKQLTAGGLFPNKMPMTKGMDLTTSVIPKWLVSSLLLVSLGWQLPANADLSGRELSKRIHDRLTGVPPSAAMLAAMETAIANGADTQAGAVAAARLAIDGDNTVTATSNFYNVTLKNWAAPWTNEDDDVFVALNDYIALVIGLVSGEEDFRQLLGGNIMYVGVSGSLPAYSMTDNNHYEQLEDSGANLGDSSVLVQRQQSDVMDLPEAAVAGIFSTRAAGEAFFIEGTNRAMLRFTLRNHLCNDLEQLKDTELPAHRIRQDVSRSPGGDSRLFLNGCVGCHSGMDPLAQAFAYYQYEYTGEEENPIGGRIVYTPGVVQEKYLINGGSFKEGFITPNDSWTNH